MCEGYHRLCGVRPLTIKYVPTTSLDSILRIASRVCGVVKETELPHLGSKTQNHGVLFSKRLYFWLNKWPKKNALLLLLFYSSGRQPPDIKYAIMQTYWGSFYFVNRHIFSEISESERFKGCDNFYYQYMFTQCSMKVLYPLCTHALLYLHMKRCAISNSLNGRIWMFFLVPFVHDWKLSLPSYYFLSW